MLGWILLVVAIIFVVAGIRIVRPTQLGLIERFGKYRMTAKQGLTWIIPLVDRMIRVDVTERMVDVQPQMIITKDDLNAVVDAVVYFKVKDPVKAEYNAENYNVQISSLARTTLRNIIGKMSLSEANSNRSKLNTELEKELDKQTDAWGIDVVRVEIQRIEPPRDVQEAMNNVVKAERQKIAAKDLALAQEMQADGDRKAAIKRADGQREASILKAKGEAKAVQLVNTAVCKYFKDSAVDYKKLETVERTFAQGSKYVIDSKSSVMNVLSDVAGITPVPARRKKANVR